MPIPQRLPACRLAIVAAAAASALTAQAQHKLGTPSDFQIPKLAAASDEGEKAIRRMQFPQGWKAELWAAEPDVAHGVALEVADDGRVFVAESFRAWNGVPDIRGIMDWLDEDLACRTVDDRLMMMQRHLGDEGMKKYFLNTERVRLLTDTDGDGRADRSQVFADNFATPLDGVAAGVLSRGNEVWFANIPNVWRLTDRDGDGVADERRSISYGYGVRVGFLGHDLHGLAWGPDGKLYFSIGDRGAAIATSAGLVGNPDCGAVFRCNPDGTELEMIYQGLRNPQDLVFDEWGNLFTGDNNSDGGDQARWTYLIEGGDSGWRIGWQFLERPNPRGPWNSEKMWHPANDAQPAYVTPPIKNITSGPSGVSYYPGTGLGADWQGTFTLCDFRGSSAGSGIVRFKHQPKGASFEIVGDERFIWAVNATDGHWGPDGAFWLLDWFDGWEPVGKGRIYRFYDPAMIGDRSVTETRDLLKAGFADRPARQLGRLLGHPNQRVRQGAQFELASRGPEAVGVLRSAATSGANVHARLHGIWGLGQVARATRATARGASSPALDAVVPLLRDADAHVRANAARVLGDARYPAAHDALAAATTDADPHVRALATIALGKLGRRESVAAIRTMLAANADADPHLRHAGAHALYLAAEVDDLVAAVNDPSEAVRMGAVLALRRHGRNEIALFLRDASPRVVAEAARAINDLPIPGAVQDLARLIGEPSDNPVVYRRVINANYRFGTAGSAKALAAYAGRTGAPEAGRAEAIELLADWPADSGRDRITGLWRPTAFARRAKEPADALRPVVNDLLAGQPDRVRAAAARAAGTLKIGEASPALAAIVTGGQSTPATRIAALNALFALGAAELPAALEAAAADADENVRKTAAQLSVEVPPATAGGRAPAGPGAAVGRLVGILDSGSLAEKQNALATLAGVADPAVDPVLKAWMERLLAGQVAPELQLDVLDAAAKRPALAALVEKQEAALDGNDPLARWRVCLTGGSVDEGRKIFRERVEVSCVRCHKAESEGGEVGPELNGLINRRDRAYLLEAIVHPNASIAEGFENILITMKSGVFYAGIIKSETADTVELLSPEDGLLKLKVSEIEEREKGLSGMPEGFGDVLSRQDLRHLVAYLASLK